MTLYANVYVELLCCTKPFRSRTNFTMSFIWTNVDTLEKLWTRRSNKKSRFRETKIFYTDMVVFQKKHRIKHMTTSTACGTVISFLRVSIYFVIRWQSRLPMSQYAIGLLMSVAGVQVNIVHLKVSSSSGIQKNSAYFGKY